MSIKPIWILLAGAGLLPLDTCRAQASPIKEASARCQALRNADFSTDLDAPARIDNTRLVEAVGDTPMYCQVDGYVAPSVGFVLWLPPDRWNGKFIELGCGGDCGTTAHVMQCDDPLRRGYACIVSDNGHRGGGNLWSYNNPQAVIDLAYRAPHVTALAGKRIAERFYHQAPQKSYFMGCSGGGRSAMMLAQRFPWDFDGIAAGGPAIGSAGLWGNWVWNVRALLDPTGQPILGQTDLDTLHAAVVSKCDLNDGVEDGVIGDPRLCHFDPTELLCTARTHSRCLTERQIEAVKKIYGGPVTSQSKPLYLPTAQRGSEQSWLQLFGNAELHKGLGEQIREEFQLDPGLTAWELKDLDFDRDYRRLGLLENLWAPTNPDLRNFKAAGGKLLMYTGWNDAIEGVLRTVDYYETAEKIAGKAATREFLRLFVVPGMNHCGGGDGASFIDYLSYLEAWVETGHAPEKLIGLHVATDNPDVRGKNPYGRKAPLDPKMVVFSRPIYPYPTRARYVGQGSPKLAERFGPVE